LQQVDDHRRDVMLYRKYRVVDPIKPEQPQRGPRSPGTCSSTMIAPCNIYSFIQPRPHGAEHQIQGTVTAPRPKARGNMRLPARYNIPSLLYSSMEQMALPILALSHLTCPWSRVCQAPQSHLRLAHRSLHHGRRKPHVRVPCESDVDKPTFCQASVTTLAMHGAIQHQQRCFPGYLLILVRMYNQGILLQN
jgi:hypothetical protein